MLKTFHGSCHCGSVRFEADIDLSQGTGKCNCSICTKMRNWSAQVKPDAFRLLEGEDALSDYQWGAKNGHFPFCRTCGMRTFSRGYVEEIGGAYVTVMLSALDDVDPAELAEAPRRYYDGRNNNNWWNAPAEVRHL